jgi:hypothetical protein
MAILPTDFTFPAAPKTEGAPALETTPSADDKNVFGSTFRGLLDSSDGNNTCASDGNHNRSTHADDVERGSVEHANEDSIETALRVDVGVEQTMPNELDFLTLKMVEISRSVSASVDEASGLGLGVLLPKDAIYSSIVDKVDLEGGLGQLTSTNSSKKQIFEATGRFSVISPAIGAQTEEFNAGVREIDSAKSIMKTEPQQLATGLSTHIRVLKSQGGGEAKLNLHPAELGRMSISVSTEGNETRVAFVVETSQARQAVESALPRLRDMLESAGLSLSDSDVSEQGDSQANTGERGAGSAGGHTSFPDGDDASAVTVLSLTVDPDRLVDTYI